MEEAKKKGEFSFPNWPDPSQRCHCRTHCLN